MDNTTSKKGLIEDLTATRESWEDLLEQVGHDRMELRGVIGEWSVKDTVVHVTAWERRALACLEAIQTGTWPEPPEWPLNLDQDHVNAWIFAANRGRRLDDVLDDSRRVFDRLMQALDSVTEQDLTESGRYPWLGGAALIASIRGNSVEHLQEHGQQIRAWLIQRETAA